MNKGEEFLLLEKENGFFEYEYKGVHYWNLIRFYLAYDIILEERAEKAHPDSNSSALKIALFPFVSNALSQVKYFWKPIEKSAYLFASNNLAKDGKGDLVDRTTYFIKDDTDFTLQRSTLVTLNQMFNTKLEGSENNSFCMLLYAIKYVLKKFIPIKPGEIEGLSEIISLCSMKFPREIERKKLENIVKQSVESFLHHKKYYKRILKKGKYKCLLIGCHYGAETFGVMQAAKELNIPVIELQHGVTGKGHIAYNILSQDLKSIYFPDVFLTYGEFWNEHTRTPASCKCIATGYAMLEDSKRFFESIEKDETIVFYSQGPIGEQLSRVAVEFCEKYNNQQKNIIYKLHPSEYRTWRTLYPELASNKKIRVIDYAMNVHELLAKHKFHVGGYSTVLYEALAFNNKVFLLDNVIQNYMEEIVADGYARYFDSAENLAKVIEEESTGEVDDSRFFCRGAKENVMKEICKVIDKG